MRWVRFLGIAVILLGAAAETTASAQTGHYRIQGRPGDRPVDGRPLRWFEIRGGSGSELGVTVRDVDQADVKREGLAASAGAAVDDVRGGSPAARAGLRIGDVIVEFDGERVRSARQLTRLVQETPAGVTVKMVVMRGGKRIEVEIVPEEGSGLRIGDERFKALLEWLQRLPQDFDRAFPELGFQPGMRPGRLGANVTELDPQLAEYFGVGNGVLVSSVTRNMPGANAGLRAGDVIISVNDVPVGNTQDLRRQVSKLEDGQAFSLGVVRDKKETTLKGKLEPGPSRPRQGTVRMPI